MSTSAPSTCRKSSDEAETALAGTATEGIRRWVLIEDRGTWGAKVPADTDLPEEVKALLADLGRREATRVQLIRRPSGLRVVDDKAETKGLRVYVAHAEPGQSALYTTQVEDLSAITRLDFEGLLGGRAAALAEFERVEEPLILVCTHGTRDQCCAKWGVPLYKKLAELEQNCVWQTSHLGGHRFAPVVLSLPDGHLYGRLAESDAEGLLEATRAGKLFDLDRLRGRCCYPQLVQAGDIFLRRALVRLETDALRHVGTDALGTDRWSVRFALNEGSSGSEAASPAEEAAVSAGESGVGAVVADDEPSGNLDETPNGPEATEGSVEEEPTRERSSKPVTPGEIQFGIEVVRLVEAAKVIKSCGDEAPSTVARFERG